MAQQYYPEYSKGLKMMDFSIERSLHFWKNYHFSQISGEMKPRIPQRRLREIPDSLKLQEDPSHILKELEPSVLDDYQLAACECVNYDLSIPECYDWKVEDVVNWLKNVVKLPQYEITFARNIIDGRRLPFVDASSIPKMNIHNFDHIKRISSEIRKLFRFDYCKFREHLGFPREEVLRYWYIKEKTKFIAMPGSSKTACDFLSKLHQIIPKKKIEVCTWDRIDPTFDMRWRVKTKIGHPVKKVEGRLFIVNPNMRFIGKNDK